MARLRRGDLLPRVRTEPPGRHSRRLSRRLGRCEAPGINTLQAGGAALLWDEALGANVLDVDGNRYIDLTSGFGVAAIGHRHPRVVAAVRRQAGRLIHGLADVNAHPLRIELARRLTERCPVADGVVYFAVSGSDAVEIALKTSLLATGRCGILAFHPSYHGLSLGALQVTSRRAFRAPFVEHFHQQVWHLPFGSDVERVDDLLSQQPAIGCVIFEPIAGREGILLPPEGWLRSLRRLCSRRAVLLIADEILTGFGRTGRWFAIESEGVQADLLCCGKAVGGGLPIAAVVGERRVMSAWQGPQEALHTGTFIANPLACAASLATLEVLTQQRLPRRAATLGSLIARRLVAWPRRYSAVMAVRGRGLMWGIELASSALGSRVVEQLRRRGVLVLTGGPDGRVVELLPPLVISKRQLELSLDLLASVLSAFDS